MNCAETKKKEKGKFLFKYYTSEFLFSFNLLFSYLVIILNDYLTPKEISFTFASYAVVTILFEIPIGIIADKFNKKSILLTGQILAFIAVLIFICQKNLMGVLLYNIIYSFRDSMFHTSNEALQYDNMCHLKIEGYYSLYKSRAVLSSTLGIGASAILAGFIVKYFNYDILKVVQIGFIILYLLYLTIIPDYRKENIKVQKLNNDYKKIIRNAFRYFFKNTTLLRLYLLYSFCFTLSTFLNDYMGLFYEKITSNNDMVGTLYGVASIVSGVLAVLIVKYFLKIKFMKLLDIFLLGSFLFLFLILKYTFPISYLSFIIFSTSFNLGLGIFSDKIHRITPSKMRATLMAISGFLCYSVYIIVIILFGYISENYNYRTAYSVMAGGYTIVVLLFYILMMFDKHSHKK